MVAGEDGGDRAHGVTAQMRRDADDAAQSQRGGDVPAPDVGDAVPRPVSEALTGALATAGSNGAGGASTPTPGGPAGNGTPPAGNGTPPAGNGTPPAGNGAPPGGDQTGDASAERRPGPSPMWQAGAYEHRPTTLGIDDYPSPPPAWPVEPHDQEPLGGEDHDPLPERQPPGDDAR
jgi:hypothetical protein